MRALFLTLAVLCVGSASHLYAQQGSVQLSAGAQATTGERQRVAGSSPFEPDLGIVWLQPRTRLGTVQFELRGTERDDQLHAGRIYGSLRDLKYRGLTWTAEAGDTYYAPTIGEYRFSNLFTPAVTFTGAGVSARSANTNFGFLAGRATAWRNIFGTDPDTLDQTLTLGRLTHRIGEKLDVTIRGSHIRTEDLQEFGFTIAASDQAGGGVRYLVTPSLHLIADGSVVWYRRAGTTDQERDGSGLAGFHWLHSRGWIQVNASRFSPGESPTLNSPLPDRDGQYAAGEYDLFSRLRVFAGWEAFRTNLDPAASAVSSHPVPPSDGSRQFGGVRVQVGSRSTVTFRVESGDRLSKLVLGGADVQSDTGGWSTDWHTTLGRWNGSIRASRRENVNSASRAASYTQQDAAAQVFFRLSRSAQLFGLTAITRTEDKTGGGNTFWQAGGGSQVQVARRGLWFRAEGTVSRNADLLGAMLFPRESLSLGLSGQLTPQTTIGVDVYVDHAPPFGSTASSPWATRSLLRVTRTLPLGPAYSPSSSLFSAASIPRDLGNVKGTVFADWDGDGVQDPNDEPVQGIPLRMDVSGVTSSGKNGEFTFQSVPTGLHQLGLDLGSLPVDFEPPSIARIQIAVSRNSTQRVAFGLIPLGSIRGRVIRDANGNGVADPTDPAIDGAVLVLDDGKRSERSRRGRYGFEAVTSGEHTVTLLADSLPEGAIIGGETRRTVQLQRDRLSHEVPFLVTVEKRAEIRKVFSGVTEVLIARVESPSPSSPPASGGGPTKSKAQSGNQFAVQIAALSDVGRARALVEQLKATGLSAYLIEPTSADPDGPYRIRVGPYTTLEDATRMAADLERRRGQKVWIVREGRASN
jgi:hypothetical protein